MFAGLPEATRVLWYQILWYGHVIITVGAVFYVIVAWDKLTHILISPVNVLFKTSRPKGALSLVDLENCRNLRYRQDRGFYLEAAFRSGCLHQLRPLPGPVSRLT